MSRRIYANMRSRRVFSGPASWTMVRMEPEDVARQADKDDAAELVRLRHAMFRAMVSADAGSRAEDVDDSSWYAAAANAIRNRMERGVLAAFVVDTPHPVESTGSDIAACAIATLEQRLPGPGFPSGLSGAMSSVHVDEPYRGRGFGRAVVTAGLAWLEESRVEIVDLHATPQAEPLYRSLGFDEPRSLALRRLLRT